MCSACASNDDTAGAEVNLVSYPEPEVARVLGLDTESDSAGAIAAVQQSTHIEAFAACMRAKGFDGFPAVFPAPPPPPSPRDPDNIQWVREFGFGISTLSTENFQSEGSGMNSFGAEPDELELYMQTLTPETQDQVSSEYDGSVGSSCSAKAAAAVESLVEVDKLAVFADAATEIRTRIDADPRAQAALTGYARCMADNGYPKLTSPAETIDSISDAFGAWITTVSFNPDSAPEADFVEQLSGETRDQLEELRTIEIETAVQSFACEEPIRPTLVEVAVEVEQTWIADNQDRLGR